MEKKNIIYHSSFLLISKLFQFVAGLIKGKLNAIEIGTAGVGVFNQFNHFNLSISNNFLFGVNGAIVKQIANSKVNSKSDNPYNIVISGALKIYILFTLLTSIFITLIVFFFKSEFSVFFFGSNSYYKFILSGIITIPLLIFDSIPSSIMQGFRGMKHIAVSKGISISLGLSIYIPAIIYFGLDGAIYSLVFSYLITLVSNMFFAWKYYLKENKITLSQILYARMDTRFITENITFASVGLFSGLTAIITDLVSRSIVVNSLGVEYFGIFSPNIVWASLFTSFFLPALRTFLYTRISELGIQTDKIISLINDALRISTVIFLPLIFIFLPLRNEIIPLLYSKEFSESGKYMPLYFSALLLRVWWHQLMVAFTPIGKLKLHGFLMVCSGFLELLLTFILVEYFALWGFAAKYFLGAVFLLLVYYIYLRKFLGFRLSNENIRLLRLILTGFFIMAVQVAFFDFWYLGLIIGSFTLMVIYMDLNINEKEEIKKAILKFTKKKK